MMEIIWKMKTSFKAFWSFQKLTSSHDVTESSFYLILYFKLETFKNITWTHNVHQGIQRRKIFKTNKKSRLKSSYQLSQKCMCVCFMPWIIHLAVTSSHDLFTVLESSDHCKEEKLLIDFNLWHTFSPSLYVGLRHMKFFLNPPKFRFSRRLSCRTSDQPFCEPLRVKVWKDCKKVTLITMRKINKRFELTQEVLEDHRQICKRSAFQRFYGWCFCRSSSGDRGWVFRSSFLVYSCGCPIVVQPEGDKFLLDIDKIILILLNLPHQDQSVWIPIRHRSTKWNSDTICRWGVRVRIATIE